MSPSASRVKLAGVTVALALLSAAAMTWLSSRGQATTSESPPAVQASTARDCPECRQLATQIGVVEQSLALMRSQLAALRGQPSAHTASDANPANTPTPTTPEDVAEMRAAEAEHHRDFMAGVAQRFAEEKIDGAWANRAASRIDTRFSEDNALRGMAHNVECRERTCRLEIEDDGSGRLPQSVPRLALGLVDVLPTFSAEQVERGDGRHSLVLYLSSQPQVAMSAAK